MPATSFLQKAKTGGKTGFDKVWGALDKLGAPINSLSNKIGSEAFWPTTLDKECDKAARILRSFCKDGFYQEEVHQTADGPKRKQKVLKKIPSKVIKNAKGLAIFTTMRTGLWVSGAGGSGILVGRKEDGTWSPPSGILLHTAGLGFLVGVDIYDCVVVINTQKALDAFSKIRCTLGGEVSAVAGPVSLGGILDTEIHKRQAPLFTYLKSRGFYAGVQIDGTIVIERSDENERFYHDRIGVADILAGKVQHPPSEIKTLMETIKAAQGDTDVDTALLTNEPAPGDYEIEEDGKTFGIPDLEDPDPFGVLALEKEGFEIREAGTQKRPTSEQFEFKPSPTSPIYNTFRRSTDRQSVDSKAASRRSSWRTSTMSTMSTIDRGVQTMDMSTQTDFDAPAVQRLRSDTIGSPKMSEIPENKSTDDSAKSTEAIPKPTTPEDGDEYGDGAEEPVVQEIHQAAAPQFISRARLVTVTKPTPPKLPPRNPIRDRKKPLIINADASNSYVGKDQATGTSSLSSSDRLSPSSLPDHSSVRSQESISSDESLGGLSERFQPKPETQTNGVTNEVTEGEKEKPSMKQEEDEFQSLPASPIKNVPGGFN
ncbi:DUF500-domain-containing protein [Lepidopterella palustris CBS 459.81]|uniref:DUF500-domain-containing protein n=1 Tax=Lepidopterella palustris CBS 459.81 TaxID=1314670 RepID=A0A8E2EL62_9PEZI|nr:DUF500-domain-containing protein [Lepidopterella palustris CBS 459.81]